MSLIQKSMFIALLVMGFATLGWAQAGKKMNATQRAEKQSAHLIEALSLDDDQAAQVKALNLKYAGQFQEVYQNTTDREQRRDRMQEIREARRAELETILTAEQLAELDTMQAERRAKAKAKVRDLDPAAAAEKRTAHLTKALQLDAQQAAQLDAVFQDFAEQIKAVMTDDTLEREAKRTALANLRDEKDAAVAAILTEAQRAEWEALKAERHGQGGKRMRKGQH